MDFGIRGKVAFITGASRGLGKAIAFSLAREGCNIAICSRDEKTLNQTAEEIKSLGVAVLAVRADVSRKEDVEASFEKVIQKWGTLHIMINNAGGNGEPRTLPIEEEPEETWLYTYSLNTLAAIRYCRLAIPYMKKQNWGRIVTLISKQGREGGGRPWYTTAKSAEMSLMKTFAKSWELTRAGITFNSVAPGAIPTENNDWTQFMKKDPEGFKKRAREFVAGRLGKPEEVGPVVAFLCSEQASLLTGACIPIDGGESSAF